MNNFVQSFEEFGQLINEADTGSNVVLNSDKAIVTLLNNESAFQAALSELNMFEFPDVDDNFADMYYTQLITPYFVQLKNEYIARVSFSGIIDYKTNSIQGKYNSKLNTSDLTNYFTRIINFSDQHVTAIHDGNNLISVTDFREQNGEFDFKAILDEDNVQEPLDVQELVTIKGSVMDTTSNKFFIFVHKNGKMRIATGYELAKLKNETYTSRNTTFLFADNVKRIFD